MLLTVKECGKGVNKDLLPSELAPGVWSDAMNVRFRNGFFETRGGMEEVYTAPAITPYWIGMYSSTTARFVVQAGIAKVYVDDGSTQTEITGTAPTGARDDRWSGGVLNGVLLLNNGVDSPMFWGGDTALNLATLIAWPANTKADVIRPFKNYIIALATSLSGTKYPHRVRWSNAAEPGAIPTAWAAAATNDAGEVDLAETAGQLVDCLPLGDQNIVYKQDGRYAMQWIGGNEVFRFVRLPGDDGLLARGCVVQTPKGHVFLTSGDVKLHNGGEAISIAEGRIREWLFASMDSGHAGRTFLCLNPQKSEVWIVFPSTDSADCDRVAAWNWTDDTWAIFSVPNVTYGATGLVASTLGSGTWADLTGTWDALTGSWDQNQAGSNEARLLVVTTAPKIGLVNSGSLDFTESIDWYLEKTGIALGDPDSLKVVSRARLQVKAVAGAQIRVKLSSTMTADEDAVFANSSTFTVGTSNWANQFAKAGRYLAIRLESMDDQPVAAKSYDLETSESKARF